MFGCVCADITVIWAVCASSSIIPLTGRTSLLYTHSTAHSILAQAVRTHSGTGTGRAVRQHRATPTVRSIQVVVSTSGRAGPVSLHPVSASGAGSAVVVVRPDTSGTVGMAGLIVVHDHDICPCVRGGEVGPVWLRSSARLIDL